MSFIEFFIYILRIVFHRISSLPIMCLLSMKGPLELFSNKKRPGNIGSGDRLSLEITRITIDAVNSFLQHGYVVLSACIVI